TTQHDAVDRSDEGREGGAIANARGGDPERTKSCEGGGTARIRGPSCGVGEFDIAGRGETLAIEVVEAIEVSPRGECIGLLAPVWRRAFADGRALDAREHFATMARLPDDDRNGHDAPGDVGRDLRDVIAIEPELAGNIDRKRSRVARHRRETN